MDGPWYTLETTKEKLGLNQEELFYHIEQFNIYPVVFTKERPFLLFKKSGGGGRWRGFGTCLYRGHILLLGDQIFRLLDEGELRIEQGMTKLQEPEAAKNISTLYPFQSPLPMGRIHEWEESYDSLEVEFLYATPMPEEHRPAIDQLPDMLFGKESSVEGERSQTRTILNFHTNSLIKIEDIRFADSQIKRLLSTLALDLECKECSNIQANVPPSLPGTRVSQLHQLIFNTMFYNPSSSALELWELIEHDYKSDAPVYDQDGIIQVMDAVCIEWCSRNGVEQSLKWTSFETLVSKLKKKLVAVS